jgi:hypothetical protein
MSMKTHLSLAASDLGRSISFYSKLLDAEPAKRLPDYALFITVHEETEDRDNAAEACCS